MMKLKTLLIELASGGMIEMENVECESLAEFDAMLNGTIRASKVKVGGRLHDSVAPAARVVEKNGHKMQRGAKLFLFQTMARAGDRTWTRAQIAELLAKKGWMSQTASATISYGVKDGHLSMDTNGRLKLTEKGRQRAADNRLLAMKKRVDKKKGSPTK